MSISNKMSHHMRTGPHDYGPREWCVFFFGPPDGIPRAAAGAVRSASPLRAAPTAPGPGPVGRTTKATMRLRPAAARRRHGNPDG